MLVKCYPLLCSFFFDRNDMMASVVCLGAYDTNAGLIAPAELLQLLSMKPTNGPLQVFFHLDEEVAPEFFVLVMRLHMCNTVGGQTLEAGADRPPRSWTDVTGHLSSFQRRRHRLTFSIDLVPFQLRRGGEMGPAEGTLAEPVDPPEFTDAAQTKAVFAGEEDRTAEPVQTDGTPEGLRHTRSPRLPVCRLLAAETGTPKTNMLILVGRTGRYTHSSLPNIQP